MAEALRAHWPVGTPAALSSPSVSASRCVSSPQLSQGHFVSAPRTYSPTVMNKQTSRAEQWTGHSCRDGYVLGEPGFESISKSWVKKEKHKDRINSPISMTNVGKSLEGKDSARATIEGSCGNNETVTTDPKLFIASTYSEMTEDVNSSFPSSACPALHPAADCARVKPSTLQWLTSLGSPRRDGTESSVSEKLPSISLFLTSKS